jgi:hypothetical protein
MLLFSPMLIGSLSPRRVAFHQIETFRARLDVADHGGIRGDPALRVELWAAGAEGINGHGRVSRNEWREGDCSLSAY